MKYPLATRFGLEVLALFIATMWVSHQESNLQHQIGPFAGGFVRQHRKRGPGATWAFAFDAELGK